MPPFSRPPGSDYTTDVSWRPAVNGEGEECPAFGLVYVAGRDAAGVYTFYKPELDGGPVWVNSPLAVPAALAGGGAITAGGPVDALYEAADGTPVPGETWGAASGSWKLRKGYAGFFVVGTPDTDAELVAVVPDHVILFPEDETWTPTSGGQYVAGVGYDTANRPHVSPVAERVYQIDATNSADSAGSFLASAFGFGEPANYVLIDRGVAEDPDRLVSFLGNGSIVPAGSVGGFYSVKFGPVSHYASGGYALIAHTTGAGCEGVTESYNVGGFRATVTVTYTGSTLLKNFGSVAVRAADFYSGDGSQGLTGTLGPGAAAKDGLVTTLGSGSFVGTASNNTFTNQNTFQPATSGTVPLTVQGATGQTANLTEWKDDGGTVGASMGPGFVFTAAALNGTYDAGTW